MSIVIFIPDIPRTWDIKLLLPKINAIGMYKLFGTIPPNLDLGTSTGDERFGNWLNPVLFTC